MAGLRTVGHLLASGAALADFGNLLKKLNFEWGKIGILVVA